jgi:ribosomal protein S18 acetylase RimI-like enzyme
VTTQASDGADCRGGRRAANLHLPGITFRPLVPGDADHLCDMLLSARTVDGPREPLGREEIRHLWFDHPGVDHERDSLAAFSADGSLLGAAAVFARNAPTTLARAFMPGAVLPTARRRGIGTQLVRFGLGRARELLANVPGEIPRQLDCESPASAPDRMAFFEAQGFRRARSFLSMHRDLVEPIEPVALPPSLVAAEWRPDLDEATRVAHNDAFRDHWGSDPLTPERWQHFVAAMPGFRADCSWLALDSAAREGEPDVVGYTLANLADDAAGGRVGWLGTIGVRRSWRHQGVATALIARSLMSFRAAGASHAGLDVDAENPTGAVRVYEALGFRAIEESIIYSKPIPV